MTPPTDDGTARQRSGGPSPVPGQPNGRKHSSLIADVDLQIAELVERSTDELRLAWRGVYGVEPPRGLSRDLLIRSLANQLQERTHGAMSRTLRRRIQALVRDFDKGAAPCDLVPSSRSARLWCVSGADTPTPFSFVTTGSNMTASAIAR